MQVFGFGVWAFWVENLAKNTKTLKLAKVGLVKVGQAHDWPKSVQKLAKVGLAEVGLAKSAMTEKSFQRGHVPWDAVVGRKLHFF